MVTLPLRRLVLVDDWVGHLLRPLLEFVPPGCAACEDHPSDHRCGDVFGFYTLFKFITHKASLEGVDTELGCQFPVFKYENVAAETTIQQEPQVTAHRDTVDVPPIIREP